MTKEKASNTVDLLKEFAKNSSSPSLSRVSTARHLTEKIFWMCIGITATIGAAYHLYTIICTYMEHNYYTSITNDFEEPLQVGIIMHFVWKLFLLGAGSFYGCGVKKNVGQSICSIVNLKLWIHLHLFIFSISTKLGPAHKGGGAFYFWPFHVLLQQNLQHSQCSTSLEPCQLHSIMRWIIGPIGGAINFCLQKSGMPMSGLVYLGPSRKGGPF